MLLHESKTLANLNMFGCIQGRKHKLMRDHDGIFLMWKTLEYFRPQSVLEIGFGSGQTLGLLYESSGASRILSVDNKHNNKENWQSLFPEAPVEWMTCDSKSFRSHEKFDFILIDGDHRYDGVVADIQNTVDLLHESSIICFDDWQWQEVTQAICDTVLDKTDLVPFLANHQQIYFHHKCHNVEDFCDNFLLDKDPAFMTYWQEECFGHSVTRAKLDNIMFIEDEQIFQLALKFYNL